MHGRKIVKLQASKELLSFLDVLIKEGFIYNIKVVGNYYFVELNFFYQFKKILVIKNYKCGKYISYKELLILKGFDIIILSTDKGFITQKEALLRGLGGYVVCIFNF